MFFSYFLFFFNLSVLFPLCFFSFILMILSLLVHLFLSFTFLDILSFYFIFNQFLSAFSAFLYFEFERFHNCFLHLRVSFFLSLKTSLYRYFFYSNVSTGMNVLSLSFSLLLFMRFVDVEDNSPQRPLFMPHSNSCAYTKTFSILVSDSSCRSPARLTCVS